MLDAMIGVGMIAFAFTFTFAMGVKTGATCSDKAVGKIVFDIEAQRDTSWYSTGLLLRAKRREANETGSVAK